jgi:hypothetical protein
MTDEGKEIFTMNQRLEEYKQQAYERGFGERYSPQEANLTKAFFELYPNLPLSERQAKSLAYALENDQYTYIRFHV